MGAVECLFRGAESPSARYLTGTAYAVFTGMGAVGAVAFGILLRSDPPTPGRLGPIALIVPSIVLLWLFTTA